MKTRLVLGGLAAALALALAALLQLNRLDEGSPSATSAAPGDAATQLSRGAYLARVGNCAGCHTAAGGAPYAGGRGVPTPFGTVFAPNLTPDAATGLGRWSADEFWRALHNGRSRDGRLLSPAFPYDNYTLVRRDDADALFAYLQSLPAVAAPARPHQLRWPFGSQAALAVWRAFSFRPGVYQDDARQDARWNRGAYLSQGLAHCSACHGSRNALGATPGPERFDGAMLTELGWYAPSLHDPREASVSGWSEADLRQWLRSGRHEGAAALGPMAEVVLGSTQHLQDDDLAAMARYLRSLPQQQSRPPATRPEPALRQIGAKLYEQHCAGCHGAQGRGQRGAYPALAGNRTVLMDEPANLLRIIQRGGFAPATAGNPRPFGMPPFAGLLTEREQAALASFLRHAWGNEAADVRELDVLRLQNRRVD
ncbi:c-type cytochrome [Paucibacter sp. APW11]|uniref:C-type cytochrome n=1 Tax=Roseateles aquae TaxID=3077235 RepID=A0ABU3PI29_9BURK|nr:c-type cytochrome [Paucibacter sp. APW11]MDT9002209.1 c-type cytochrome [Paucibacter sp. APW11]